MSLHQELLDSLKMATRTNVTITLRLPLRTIATILRTEKAETNREVLRQVGPQATAGVIRAIKAAGLGARQRTGVSNNERPARTIRVRILADQGCSWEYGSVEEDATGSEIAEKRSITTGIPINAQILSVCDTTIFKDAGDGQRVNVRLCDVCTMVFG